MMMDCYGSLCPGQLLKGLRRNHSFVSKILETISVSYIMSTIREVLLVLKTCEAKHEMQSVSKFSDVLFALKPVGPPVDEALGQVDIFVRSLGQANLWSDIPPSRSIWWPRVVLCQVSLTFGQPLGQVDLWSNVPLVEASNGQEWY